MLTSVGSKDLLCFGGFETPLQELPMIAIAAKKPSEPGSQAALEAQGFLGTPWEKLQLFRCYMLYIKFRAQPACANCTVSYYIQVLYDAFMIFHCLS